MYGLMLQTKVVKMDGDFLWQLKKGAKVLAQGIARTEKEAKKKLEEAAGKTVVADDAEKNARRNLKVGFKDRVRRRPYLAAHVIRCVLGELEDSYILNNAGDEEQRLHLKVTKKVLNMHPLAASPRMMADRMLADIEKLWPKEKPHSLAQLERWAKGFLGDTFVMYLEGKLEN